MANTLQNTSLFHVVIRANNERTEALSVEVAKKIFGQNPTVIKKSPFVEALKATLISGIESSKTWLVCIDADVLIYKSGVEKLVKEMLKSKEQVFEVQGRIVDKFFPMPKKGGIHAYRIKHLKKGLEVINQMTDQSIKRPEKTLITTMDGMGYKHKSFEIIVGLHDYEQFNQDIFRKCFFHAQKHLSDLPVLIPFWKKNLAQDQDFKIALDGLAAGIQAPDMNYFKTSSISSRLDMTEEKSKLDISLDQFVPLINNICDEQQKLLTKKNRKIKVFIKKIPLPRLK